VCTSAAVAAGASALAGPARLRCRLWCAQFRVRLCACALDYPVHRHVADRAANGIRGLKYLEVDPESPRLDDARFCCSRGYRNSGAPFLFGVAKARCGCAFGFCDSIEIFTSSTARRAVTVRRHWPLSGARGAKVSVAIADYGSGNLHSAAKAFERAARESGRG